jgi:hypothetical protein
MSVDDIDGDGTHVDDLDPRQLSDYLLQASSDLEKRARELLMANAKFKPDAAQRLTDKVAEYLALCNRHAMVRWDEWNRVEKLRAVAKSLRELGEPADADRFDALAGTLATHCFEEGPKP